jgi:hypothetical protein
LKLHRASIVLALSALALASCATTQNSVYQSKAPEARGERAIASSIELVKEVDLGDSILGVFFSRETYQSGEAQNLLFTRRQSSAFGKKTGGAIVDYDLSRTSSLSADQGRKFLNAIDEYLGTDPKALPAEKMVNFELYSGTLDMTSGDEHYRPFDELTFIVIASVTNKGKSFRTIFPGYIADMYGRRRATYASYELKEDQVKNLREAVNSALAKATIAPTANGKAL